VLLIADTSVLINFLKIDRISLLGKHSPRCAIIDHVLAEITDFYPDQQSRLNAAIHEAYVEVTPVTADAEVDLFARLQGLPSRPLGAGECSAIAVALTRGYSLAMDDRLAIRHTRAFASSAGAKVQVLTTQDIVVRLIRAGALRIEQADVMLVAWRSQHRFNLPIKSFADLL
jgi:predicted nucleic acid-binding protein